jgi:predicted Rossmann-fold nucleotide-binding protein
VARHLDLPGGVEAAPHIGVFASARDPTVAPRLHRDFGREAKMLGRRLAENGFSMLTGGCPGIVDAAQAEFVRKRKNPARQLSVGIRIQALEVPEPANPHLDIQINASNFGSRLELMQLFCDGCVMLPGGLGTLLELAFFLQYSQVARNGRGMPICLLPGSFWNPMRDQLARMAAFNTVTPGSGDTAQLHWVDSVNRATEILLNHNGNRERVAR